jgi:hypothetical protein
VNLGPPSFEGVEVIPDMQVSVGEVKDFILPKVVVPDGGAFSLTLEGLARVIGFTE